MPYDPNFPATRAELISASFRNQFHGMKDLIDAIPGITDVVVDSVTMLNPGEPATVTLSVIGTVLHASFAIPRGADGLQGLQGIPGSPGQPFANVIIDGVNTLNSGEPASVWISFDGVNVHLVFNIPRGPQGEQGIQGPMGEVTSVMMGGAISTAIAGTSNNTNSVATLDTPFTNDPLSLADGELIRAKINELILAQRR
jgi:hypothetical protein